MPRYIDADALKDELELADFETDSRMFGGQTVLFEDSVFKIVDSAPTISPDEVRGVGKWLIDEQEVGGINGERQVIRIPYCSNCGTPNEWNTNYCPNCGAKMKGAEDGTTD